MWHDHKYGYTAAEAEHYRQFQVKRSQSRQQSALGIPIKLLVQVRKRVQSEGRWQECKRLAATLAEFLGKRAARPMALYCMPRDDGQPHEFEGLMPKRLRIYRGKAG